MTPDHVYTTADHVYTAPDHVYTASDQFAVVQFIFSPSTSRSIFNTVSSDRQGRRKGLRTPAGAPFRLAAFQPSSFILHLSSFALALLLAFNLAAQSTP